MKTAQRTAFATIGIGITVLALKTYAWHITGSAALYSDALETVVNVVASLIAYWAVRFAAQPADHNHPYGHAKVEFIAAVAEGALIVVAAVSILNHAYFTYLFPRALTAPLIGIAVNLAGTAINLVWALHLFSVSRRMRSPALRGDARHLMADVVTGIGVTMGVALAVETGRLWLDPVVAALTAVYVLWSGVHLIGQSMGALMDMAPTDGTVTRIEDIIRANGKGAIEAHEVRARSAGRMTFVQFHLVVPGEMTVVQSHEICDRIETALRREMSHLVINIHVEPEHKIKPDGAIALR